MATVAKLDILGSTLTLGVSSNRFDRAIRIGRIEGLLNLASSTTGTSNNDLYDAIDLIFADVRVGLFHRQIPGGLPPLPLQRIRAVKIGADIANVTLLYGRTFRSFPTGTASARARYRLAYESIEVYGVGHDGAASLLPEFTTAGFPGGVLNVVDGLSETTVWTRPVIRIGVPVDLPFNPFNSGIAQLVGKINSDTVTFDGINLPGNFAPGWVRFEGAEIVHRVENGTQDRYTVFYEFTVARGGFYQQRFDSTNATGNGYVEVLQYEMVPFAGQFPTS